LHTGQPAKIARFRRLHELERAVDRELPG
jgi:hypothetical protein